MPGKRGHFIMFKTITACSSDTRSHYAIACLFLFLAGQVFASCPDYELFGERYEFAGPELRSGASFNVRAGGSQQIADCRINYAEQPTNGRGHVETQPDFSFNLSQMAQYKLIIDVRSECDAILLVNTGAANWHYDDDDRGNYDPKIILNNPSNGWVDVWVGANDRTCNAKLTLKTERKNMPLIRSAAEPSCPDYELFGERYEFAGPELRSGASFNVRAGGSQQIADCRINYAEQPTNGRGHVETQPDFSFNLSQMAQYKLIIDVRSECDAILLVNTGAANWYYDDDDRGNYDPKIILNNPSNGWVDVWVGANDRTCNAKLTLKTERKNMALIQSRNARLETLIQSRKARLELE